MQSPVLRDKSLGYSKCYARVNECNARALLHQKLVGFFFLIDAKSVFFFFSLLNVFTIYY